MSHFIVTIDTEEEGLWNGRYRRTEYTVDNIREVSRFQNLCDQFGIRPTYLIDAPVVQDEVAVNLLRAIQDDGRAEIGTHVHPWCNPPFEEEISSPNSYLCNLPKALQRAKIEWLTDAIERRFGRRPTSFRAGRYGLDIIGARILEELGYVVDSSVIPFSDFSSDGGPDFQRAPHKPYFTGGNDLNTSGGTGDLLEVPVTVGFNRMNFPRADAIRRFASRSPLRQLRCVGLLDRLGIVRRIKFSPEQADVPQLKTLVDVLLRQNSPCLVMMFHSSSLLPGHSPYVPDQNSMERFYQRLTEVFEYCLRDRGCVNSTLTEFAREFYQRNVMSNRN